MIPNLKLNAFRLPGSICTHNRGIIHNLPRPSRQQWLIYMPYGIVVVASTYKCSCAPNYMCNHLKAHLPKVVFNTSSSAASLFTQNPGTLGTIDFGFGNFLFSLSWGWVLLVLHIWTTSCIRTLQRGGMYWEIHPPRTERFPEGGDYPSPSSRSIPRPKGCKIRGREKSQGLKGMYFPIYPDSWQYTAIWFWKLALPSVSVSSCISWKPFNLALKN